MRWLIDECVDAALVALWRESGHDAVYMSDVAPRATDVEVMNRAHRESRLLLTEDKDFGELVFRHGLTHAGIILFRLPSGGTDAKIERLRRLLVTHGDRLAEFVVVNPRNVRVRTVARK